MLRLREEIGMSIMLITHNLGVVSELADKVVVMYAGKIVESADIDTIFRNSLHPYTIGLLGSIPKLDEDRERLQVIRGTVPSPFKIPDGCSFQTRCLHIEKRRCNEEQVLRCLEPGHFVRCWKSPDF
jgi:peptide/nickel transport system ATP-binding protein/oligopeptide transport system ATP-binding protein